MKYNNKKYYEVCIKHTENEDDSFHINRFQNDIIIDDYLINSSEKDFHQSWFFDFEYFNEKVNLMLEMLNNIQNLKLNYINDFKEIKEFKKGDNVIFNDEVYLIILYEPNKRELIYNKISKIFVLKDLKDYTNINVNVNKHKPLQSIDFYYENIHKLNEKITKENIKSFIKKFKIESCDDYLNVNCENCKKCFMCVDCKDCKRCFNCIGCKNCKYSNDIFFSEDCHSCKNSRNIINCFDSKYLLNCKKCDYSKNMDNCKKCKACNNCSHCKKCKYSINIKNCNNCSCLFNESYKINVNNYDYYVNNIMTDYSSYHPSIEEHDIHNFIVGIYEVKTIDKYLNINCVNCKTCYLCYNCKDCEKCCKCKDGKNLNDKANYNNCIIC